MNITSFHTDLLFDDNQIIREMAKDRKVPLNEFQNNSLDCDGGVQDKKQNIVFDAQDCVGTGG
ncbi:hypothetical protein [Mucilaginibacter jinjuensis]|uniref:Uncharacterized protein n=1 Tax=Mucilaginibacter jinjuensis TaxID=1176721 RepID=A0ABY7TDM9_9SPHI|nr:hypothetical protein [Mucilaginibacter jinjuensis]WCT14441.1 hypothetical protein PQO05_10905 [Mucilaginibacter jinjuensis]